MVAYVGLVSQKPVRDPSARLFFALDPPDSIRDSLLEWQRGALADPGLRPVAAQALHCTLCFLGSRPEAQLDQLSAALRPELAETVEIHLDREPVAIPDKRPRLIALGVVSEAAQRLQGRLIRGLADAGLFEQEDRPFWPHFTVARVRAEPGGKRRSRRVESPSGALPADLLSPFHAVRVALYRSYLRPSGSHYVSLASLELPHPAQSRAEKR